MHAAKIGQHTGQPIFSDKSQNTELHLVGTHLRYFNSPSFGVNLCCRLSSSRSPNLVGFSSPTRMRFQRRRNALRCAGRSGTTWPTDLSRAKSATDFKPSPPFDDAFLLFDTFFYHLKKENLHHCLFFKQWLFINDIFLINIINIYRNDGLLLRWLWEVRGQSKVAWRGGAVCSVGRATAASPPGSARCPVWARQPRASADCGRSGLVGRWDQDQDPVGRRKGGGGSGW